MKQQGLDQSVLPGCQYILASRIMNRHTRSIYS